MPQERKKTSGTQKYATAEELSTKCEEYFRKCDKKGKLYGEAGLALYLDVTLTTLRNWYDGNTCPELQDTVQKAYLRIQEQTESDPAYMEKGMVTKAIFLMKQSRLGGYQDKIESKQDIAVKVKMGENVEESDFK